MLRQHIHLWCLPGGCLMLLWPRSSSETKNDLTIKDAVITIYMATAWLGLFCCRTGWSLLDCQRNVTNNAFMIISITSRVETLSWLLCLIPWGVGAAANCMSLKEFTTQKSAYITIFMNDVEDYISSTDSVSDQVYFFTSSAWLWDASRVRFLMRPSIALWMS
jgi:hypothetical protein